MKSHLQSVPGNGYWVLLTNMAFSVTHQLQSDEIDLVAIGPPGVRVIEVKHWTSRWVDAHTDLVQQQADKVTNKARKIGTTLRKLNRDLPRVDAAILLTQEASKVRPLAKKEVRGVHFHTLSDWKAAIDLDSRHVLSSQQVMVLGRSLEPKSAVAMDGSLRRLAGYVNLELQTAKEERFHRIYRGSHPARRDRVVLHLYDLSASDDPNAEAKAKREFEALHRLQLFSWAPRILDSYQDAPGYAGEMFFFTVVDTAAPSLAERASDTTWSTESRLAFARKAALALNDLHQTGIGDELIVHRNLTPRTILVRHDNSPILTGLDRAKIPSDISVASAGSPLDVSDTVVAPEVRLEGLTAADQRSDVYSLCASLSGLFEGRADPASRQSLKACAGGLADDPEQRCTLEDLDRLFSRLLGDSIPPPVLPPARFWTEEQLVRFHERDYRIVARLGSGGIGTTFKVVEIDRSTREDLGTYVGKVGHNGDTGRRVLHAYSLARSHLGRHPGLSAIFEVAREWRENDFIALMTWIDGAPLREFMGVFPLLAEDQQEVCYETLALRWIVRVCDALHVLHRNGLIHGDVSPSNLIVSGSELVLTDYDFVGKIGEPVDSPGTLLYCSPSCQEGQNASASDDIYALAASLFHVIFEKEPFDCCGAQTKQQGLNWGGVSREECPRLATLLDKATHPDPRQRFASALEVTEFIKGLRRPEQEPRQGETATKEEEATTLSVSQPSQTKLQPVLREQHVDWLRSLLQSYPGSVCGNAETRGLDTDFAVQTYVETELEDAMFRDIRERRVRLIILCGNAGDGKTALLQHLANRLGLGRHSSSERILKGRMQDGLVIHMNLDGSAAWQGRSADTIMDEFLAPFQHGAPADDIVHLLAVNDGRLLEWIERVDERHGDNGTQLTRELSDLLQQVDARRASYIRFISLNQRSLVGGLAPDEKSIETSFLERLLDHLYGGEHATSIWSPCESCSAKERCEVFRAARVFGPDGLPGLADTGTRNRARQRLFQALQAVHLRGETHITVRELRAALVYILFGVHYCEDYHGASDVTVLPYWDRAFDPRSPCRQGDVLEELARFDPALEAHPQIDRHLLRRPSPDGTTSAPHYHNIALDSGRRRAFFEWTPEQVDEIAGHRDALDLARGRHLRRFRDLAIDKDPQQRARLCARLAGGISRLEDLPPQALERPKVVPLRITPRTPTESAFWAEKPLAHFRLEPDLPAGAEGLQRLHRQAFLIYRYRDRREERLRLGAELFHLLLELSEGYQLGDVSTDDIFAHLSIFVQRLVREDERVLFAWNPMQDEEIHRVSCEIANTADGPQQRMILTALMQTGHK